MTYRALTARIPIWIRVSSAILLVLAGVLIATMLLYNTSVGDLRSGGHGSRGGMEMTDHNMSGDHSGGDHGSRGDHSGGDHGGDHSSDGGS